MQSSLLPSPFFKESLQAFLGEIPSTKPSFRIMMLVGYTSTYLDSLTPRELFHLLSVLELFFMTATTARHQEIQNMLGSYRKDLGAHIDLTSKPTKNFLHP